MYKRMLSKTIVLGLFLCLPLIGLGHGHKEEKEDEHHEKQLSVDIPKDVATQQGIKLAKVGSAEITTELEVIGKIVPNRDRIVPVYPRFLGIVKNLTKRLGDTVNANEIIAKVESNESLQSYDIRAPFEGVIVQKFVNVGEIVKENKPLYEIADLSNVWVDLSIYRKEAYKIKKGQPVIIKSEDNLKHQVESVIDYVSPIGVEDSQTLLARVNLSNTDHQWLPGMYVDALITIEKKQVSMAVTHNALQKINNKMVVFVQEGEKFVPIPVETGLQNSSLIEIVSGLKPGQIYVSENSFILKADLGKGAAEHEH